MTTTTTIATIVTTLILLTTTIPTTTSTPILGLDTFLSHQSHHDPHASNDTFLHLTNSLKKSLSSSPSLTLTSLHVTIPIHVTLVGPPSSFPSSSPSNLLSFLSASVTTDFFHVITPPNNNLNHKLSIQHSPSVHVSLSSPSLTSSLTNKIKSEIATTTVPLRSSLVSISYKAVDDVIRSDYEKETESHDEGVYVYLLNLGQMEKRYGYKYGESGGEASLGFTKCSGTIWSGEKRYLWIDMSAGPVDYGPALSGDGVLPRGEFHPLSGLHYGVKSQKSVLADVASLVWSAYKVLLVPSLRVSVPFENELVVQFVHVRGGEKDVRGLDFGVVERNLVGDGLLFSDQVVKFKTYEVDLAECAICSFAISLSTTSYTSRYLFDNYTLIVSEYLDSKRMHQTLSDAQDEIRRLAGLPEEDFGRVLPVYVFDLDVNSILLLDRYHQSVAFKDMVIAVRTKNTQTVSDYSCNGRHVFTQTRELERPLVGSILQSMWGVSPTHLVWSAQHNSTLVDYTWSVGNTPFGPFSELSSLSFIQKDAAKRNVILTSLNFTITSALDILESISAHGGERKLLPHSQLSEFIQRWNLFKYKLDKVVSSLSHLDFETALYYLRSSDHDLYAIHSLVYHASQDLEASLVCFEDPPFPWASFLMSVGIFFVLVYAYSQRDKLFSNKRKQF